MSFFTHTPGGVIITDLPAETYELIDSQPQETESGWDTCRLTYLIMSAVQDPVILLDDPTFQRGTEISYAPVNLWVTGRSARTRYHSLHEVTVNTAGIIAAKGAKVSYDGLTQTQTVQNAVFPDPDDVLTLFPKVNAKERNITATIELPLVTLGPNDASFPTALVGTNEPFPTNPLDAGILQPAVPDSIWGFLTSPTYHYPNGWILDAVTLENLAGLSTVFWAKYKFIHQHPYSA